MRGVLRRGTGEGRAQEERGTGEGRAQEERGTGEGRVEEERGTGEGRAQEERERVARSTFRRAQHVGLMKSAQKAISIISAKIVNLMMISNVFQGTALLKICILSLT